MKNLILMAVVTISLAACHRNSDNDRAGAEAMPVETAHAVSDSVVIYKTYPGYLSADKAVDVVGRVNGIILTKNYEDGQYVSKGDVLFTVESTTYNDLVRQAEASLTTAKSNYSYARSRYEAMKKAFDGDAVSQMDLNQAASNFKQSEAAIRNAEAALSTARTNLSHCRVTAPISGYVTTSTLTAGDYLSGGMSPVKLATIYDDRQMKAVFSIEDARYISMLRDSVADNRLLHHIPITFSEKLPHDYTADLYYMSPSVDKSTGTMTLEARLANPDRELKAGMYCSISLPVGTDPKAVLVKDASIGSDQLGSYLYTVNDSDRVVYTSIKTGEMANDSMRIVSSGLDAGTLYVTKALLKVRDGLRVKPVVTE